MSEYTQEKLNADSPNTVVPVLGGEYNNKPVQPWRVKTELVPSYSLTSINYNPTQLYTTEEYTWCNASGVRNCG